MNYSRTEVGIGAAAILVGVFLLLVGIPYGITSPSNVSRVVLSPVFWPSILAGLMVLIGLGLIASSVAVKPAPPPEAAPIPAERGSWARLAAMAVLMVLYLFAIPRIGMVWASIPAFIAVALLVRTQHRVISVVAAICVPLVLYAFFVHVAGVSIPQGHYVRLP